MKYRFSPTARLLLTIFGLLAILLFMGGATAYFYYTRIDSLHKLNAKVVLGNLISDTLHSMQMERGLSSGYILNRLAFKKRLMRQRRVTDAKLTHLKSYLQTLRFGTLGQIRAVVTKTEESLHRLRAQIDEGAVESPEAIRRYSALNQTFLDIIIEIAKESHVPAITQDIIGYSHFLFMKEFGGLERAQGVVILSRQTPSVRELIRFANLIALQREHEKLFERYADVTIRECYAGDIANPVFQKVRHVESHILNDSLQNVGFSPSGWYELISKKLQIYDNIGKFIERHITGKIAQQTRHAETVFLTIMGLIAVGLLLFVILLRAFLALAANEKKLREVMDKYIISSITDTKGKILEVSQAFCDISGYSKEELVGQNHNIVRHPDMPKEVFADLWRTIKAGKSWRGKIKNRKKNGDFYWVYANIEPLFDEKGEIEAYIGIRLDMTQTELLQEKIKEEEEKNRLQEEMLQQQYRLAQMGEMLSMIAHQWRQPLSAITAAAGSLQLKARRDRLDNKTALQIAEKITDFSKHLSATIDDFRNFFKSDKSLQRTDFKRITEAILPIVEPSLQKNGVTLTLQINEVAPLLSHENELKQVVLNLIKNAEEALVEREVEQPRITIVIEGAKLVVKDNAGGIPESIMPKIFNPYFSTKLKKDGTGLGLYMSKVIIEDHCGGTLRVHNDAEGAVFSIELERHDG